MKTSDIPDDVVRAAVLATRGRNDVPQWATTWDILAELGSHYPPKLILSKLRSMVRRGVIGGHACRLTYPYCRGDFELLDDESLPPIVKPLPRGSATSGAYKVVEVGGRSTPWRLVRK